MKIKYVQLFTKDGDTAEIDGEFIKELRSAIGIDLHFKEGETEYGQFFPWWNVSVVRYYTR